MQKNESQPIQLLDSKHKHLAPLTLIKLNNNQMGQPLFCIHAVGGHVIAYAQLAHILENKYSVYGIQSPGLTSSGHQFYSIEDMSKYYIAEIKKVQPQGPYFFLGWSMGGLIAQEISYRLNEAGETVSLLSLLDVHDPALMHQKTTLTNRDIFNYLIGTTQSELDNKI
jgi:thioesterase domain-containing protein